MGFQAILIIPKNMLTVLGFHKYSKIFVSKQLKCDFSLTVIETYKRKNTI